MSLSPRRSFTPITVVVADQDVLACNLLASRLRKHRQFQVTECTENETATLDLLRRVRPSVALIGEGVRDDPKGGYSILKKSQSWSPRLRAVMLLGSSDQHSVVEAFRAGARGIVLRSDCQFAALCKCVHNVHQGQVWADNKQVGYVLEAFSRSSALQTQDPKALGRISGRERDVVRLAVDGLSNREIAQRLDLSEHTVKNYLFRVFDKLGISSRVELVHFALTNQEILTVANPRPAIEDLRTVASSSLRALSR